MHNLIRLDNLSKDDIFAIFKLADEITQGRHRNVLKGKTIVMFFPSSSIRTRMTFEKGIHQLGAQSILFPNDALDKKEDLCDVAGYLSNWTDCIIVRHKDMAIIERLALSSSVPVVNAMTNTNHPCEILSDLYAFSKIRTDYLTANYLYVGTASNIGLTWKRASDLFGFSFRQCCPKNFDINDAAVERDIEKAVLNIDVVLTDSIPSSASEYFKGYQITSRLMGNANPKALLNTCPPFFREEEVSAEVLDSQYFVGYEFKKALLEVQQAIILYLFFSS